MVKKFIEQLRKRWEYLLLGLIIGIVSDDAYCAFIAGTCTAGGMQAKNIQWVGSFGWVDFGSTLVGVVVGYLIRVALCRM